MEQERRLLQRLSVFVGGWTLESAEAVCGYDGLEGFEVLDALAGLVRKSLVVAGGQTAGEMRYHLLETVRQYAREKLLDTEAIEAVRDRHLDYFLWLSEQAEPHLRSHDQLAWNDRLEVEVDNLRAALEWSEQEQVEKGQRIACSLCWFWHSRSFSYRDEIAGWLERVLAEFPLPENASREQRRLWADAVSVQQFLSYFVRLDHANVTKMLDKARAVYESLGREGRAGLVFLYGNWGAYERFITYDLSRAQELTRRSLAIAEELGDLFSIAETLPWANRTDDLSENIRAFERGLDLRRQIGDLEGLWWDLLHLANLYAAQGETDRAMVLYDERMEIAQEVKNTWGLGLLSIERGINCARTGRIDEAAYWMALALEKVSAVGHRYHIIIAKIGLALILAKIGNRAQAQVHFDEAHALAGKASFTNLRILNLFCQGEAAWDAGDLALAEQHYSESEATSRQYHPDSVAFGQYGLGKVALARGEWAAARMYFRQAIQTWMAFDIRASIPPVLKAAAVLAACQIGMAQALTSLARTAARLHGAGQALGYLSRLDVFFWHTFESFDLAERLAPARAALGEEAYQQAFAEGQAMTLEQAVLLVLDDPGALP
jgi:tetratricopeptide (TPR) repeat protein